MELSEGTARSIGSDEERQAAGEMMKRMLSEDGIKRLLSEPASDDRTPIVYDDYELWICTQPQMCKLGCVELMESMRKQDKPCTP